MGIPPGLSRVNSSRFEWSPDRSGVRRTKRSRVSEERIIGDHDSARVNQRWSLDFAGDAFSCARRSLIVAVVDDCTRECVRLVPDTSMRQSDAWSSPQWSSSGMLCR
jgi:transposase InsO family protein